MKSLRLALLACILTIAFTGIAHAQVKFSFPEESKTYAVNLSPGEETSVNITYTNIATKPVEVKTYAVDGATTSTGSFAAKLLADPQLLLGKWSSFEKYIYQIEPRESITIPLKISVPSDATPGDYSGAIAMEYKYLQENDTLENNKPVQSQSNNVGAGVTFSMRYATPFYVKISGDIKQELIIGELNFKKTQKNKYRASLNFENKGNTAISIKIIPSEKALINTTAKLKEQQVTLFPKEQLNLPIELGDLGLFNIYNLKTEISYASRDIISGKETHLGTAIREGKLYVIPWLYIIITLIALLLIITALIGKKVYYNAIIKKSSSYTATQGDTLNVIARRQGLSWKLLAKINNLKEPYEITTGQKIIVPPSKNKTNNTK